MSTHNNTFRSVILGIIIIALHSFADVSKVIKVASAGSDAELPFALVRIPEMGILHCDERGITEIRNEDANKKTLHISAFQHEPAQVKYDDIKGDTALIRLVPSFKTLAEINIKPWIKDRDIKFGKNKHKFFWNTMYWLSPYREDSVLRIPTPFDIGVEINAPEGKANVLKTFGLNAKYTDSTLSEFDVWLNIYDVTDHVPTDQESIPVPAYEPIMIHFSKDQLNRKEKEYRYEFDDPLILPEKAVIIVNWSWCKENDKFITEGEKLELICTKTGKYYAEGNPYKEYYNYAEFFNSAKLSPFFWEYTQYSLPE